MKSGECLIARKEKETFEKPRHAEEEEDFFALELILGKPVDIYSCP